MGMLLLRFNKFKHIYNSDDFDSWDNVYTLVYKKHEKHTHLKIIYGHFFDKYNNFISKEVINIETGELSPDFTIYDDSNLLLSKETNDIYISNNYKEILHIYKCMKDGLIFPKK